MRRLPVSWGREQTPTWEEYAAALRACAPTLFDATFRRVVTEFGAALNCRYGWLASVVEVPPQPPQRTRGRRVLLREHHVSATRSRVLRR